jgi:hypothetical protein
MTWRPHILHVRKKASQRLGVLDSLLNRRRGLSIRNAVLLYKQLIRPMMDYACPMWRCTVRNYVKQLQALHSKCLRISTSAPWYITSRQINEDLGVPFFEEHTRALTERLKISWCGEPLSSATRQIFQLTDGRRKPSDVQATASASSRKYM